MYCEESIGIPQNLHEGPLRLIRRQDLCYCSLSAGNYFLHEDMLECRKHADDYIHQDGVNMYHTINTAVVEAYEGFLQGVVKDKNDNNLYIELERETDQIVHDFEKMRNNSIESRLVIRKVPLDKIRVSGDIITADEIAIDAPDHFLKQIDPEDHNILEENAPVAAGLAQVVAQVEANKEAYATKGDFNAFSDDIGYWLKAQKYWMIILFAAAILGVLAFLISTYLCKNVQTTRRMFSSLNGSQAGLIGTGISLSNLQTTEAMHLHWYKEDGDAMEMMIRFDWNDILIGLCMIVVVIVMIYLTYTMYRQFWIATRVILNTRKHCQTLACEGWSCEETTCYVQFSALPCKKSVKFYAGTLIGPPNIIKIESDLRMEKFQHKKSVWKYELEINWGKPKLDYLGERCGLLTHFSVPKINVRKLILTQHILSQKDVRCDLVFVFNGCLTIRPVTRLQHPSWFGTDDLREHGAELGTSPNGGPMSPTAPPLESKRVTLPQTPTPAPRKINRAQTPVPRKRSISIDSSTYNREFTPTPTPSPRLRSRSRSRNRTRSVAMDDRASFRTTTRQPPTSPINDQFVSRNRHWNEWQYATTKSKVFMVRKRYVFVRAMKSVLKHR